MVSIRAAPLTKATEAQLADVAVIFDQYRRHYGEPVIPGQTLAWLTGNIRQRRLTIFTAHLGKDLAGLATQCRAARVPAAELLLAASGSLCHARPAAPRGRADAAECRPRGDPGRLGYPRIRPDRTRQHNGAPALPHQRLCPCGGLQVLMLPLQHGDT